MTELARYGAPLTARELEILVLASGGKSNPQIGAALYLADTTIKAHMRRIMRKLGATDRTHAVVKALAPYGVRAGRSDEPTWLVARSPLPGVDDAAD